MRKVLLIALLSSYAFAFDFEAIEESGRALSAALSSSVDSYVSGHDYLPGYGFSFFAYGDDYSDGAAQAEIESMKHLILTLAPSIKGLDEGDWISATFSSDQSVLVRVKQNQPDTLEVWVDGVKR